MELCGYQDISQPIQPAQTAQNCTGWSGSKVVEKTNYLVHLFAADSGYLKCLILTCIYK
jgi:hypothetical protein